MAQPQMLFPDDRRRVGLLGFGCNSGLAADDALTPKGIAEEMPKGIPRDGSDTPGWARYQARGVTVLSRLIQNSHLSPEANDAAVDSAAAQANVRTGRGVCHELGR